VDFTKPTDTYKLSNGVEIPCIGFGTWQIADGKEASDAVLHALEAGYRHIDTAYAYGNERGVGDGIKRSGLPREDLFITSKLENPTRGYQETLDIFQDSLDMLGTDYLDLYLVHWPNPIHFRDSWKEKNAESWRAMEKLYKEGKIRAIGVSNFFEHHLEALDETAEVKPMVNQIHISPGETQSELVSYCRSRGMLIEAYSPLGTGKVLESPDLITLAHKYRVSVPQLCLRWSLQNGYLPLPKSKDKDRSKQNLDVFGFVISDEDILTISSLRGVSGEQTDPDTAPF